MLKRKLNREVKKIVLYGLIFYSIIMGVYLLVSIVLQVNTNEVRKNEIIRSEERLVNVERRIVSNKINRLISDTLYISDSLAFYDLKSNNYEDIKKQWISFSDRKKIYDQIRYIDLEGNEIIRINYSKDGSFVTKEEGLQNKKDRYYFADTISLDRNQIYISKMDLNIENDKIENPIKPMIRLSTPFYGKNGQLEGIVILNYYAQDVLEQIKEVASTGRGSIFLLNSEGYWLYNNQNHDKEWTFMYEERKDVSFANEYKLEWKAINEGSNGTIHTSNGFFPYTKIFTNHEFSLGNTENSLVLGEGDWTIVSEINQDHKNNTLFFTSPYGNVRYVLKNSILSSAVILLISVVFALLMTKNDISKEQIKYFSEYDVMTGVYNRRAGFVQINKAYKDAVKNEGKISACFIDVNGLKEVNDNLGHEAGDELILSIVNGIKEAIRESDFILRLGGDEFLIIFHGSNEEEAELIWERIKVGYNKINKTENRKYLISVSHGIVEFKFNTNEYIDNIINAADEKMYNEKRIIKKDIKIIRG